jgi:hypothetical protein
MLTIIACSGAGSLGHVSDIAKAGPHASADREAQDQKESAEIRELKNA